MCGSDICLQDGSRETLSKRKKIYIAFMDLEKAYDKVNWLALWDVLKIYGVGGKLLSAIKSFYEKASVCVKISGETSEHFEIKVGLRQGCHVTMVAEYLYGWCYERNERQSWGSWSRNVC